MKVVLPKPGRYVVAVSGGVDSVVLLDLLAQNSGYELIVAHFDHGIRPDSAADRKFVAQCAQRRGTKFEYAEGKLGAAASEATARSARYKFLRHILHKYHAQAIITAHHQDDMLETAIINMLRGTGRKGLTALRNQSDVIRPLLGFKKDEILRYARQLNLKWREDSTNQDLKYLRNYVRHTVLPRFSHADRQRLLAIISDLDALNSETDTILVDQLSQQSKDGLLDRHWFNTLPHATAQEVLAAWLRDQQVRDFDRRGLERLTIAAKVAHPGSHIDVLQGKRLAVTKDNLALVGAER